MPRKLFIARVFKGNVLCIFYLRLSPAQRRVMSTRPQLLGFAGSAQSGKTELRDAGVFSDSGLTMINLNNVGNELRAVGSPSRDRFTNLMPAELLYDDGRRKAPYYNHVATRPNVLDQLIGRDGIPFDHVILLDPVDRTIWYERLRIRAMARAWEGTPPTGQQVADLMEAIGWGPDTIRTNIEAMVPAHKLSVVDTSPDDWGETNLRAELARLGW